MVFRGPILEVIVEGNRGELTVMKLFRAEIDHNLMFMLVQQYGVQGFPTIKVFGLGKSPVDYQGGREAKPIVDYALQQVCFFNFLHCFRFP